MIAQGISPASSIKQFNPSALLKKAWKFNAPLTIFTVVMVVTTVAGFIGLVVDDRLVTGMPAWAKTTKFSVSLALYAASLMWMLSYVKGRPRLVGFIQTASALLLTLEMVIVILQTIRGQASHFNVSDSFNTTLFSVMGAAISTFWLINLLGAVLLLFQPMPNRTLGWSMRLGIIIALIGMALAFLMTANTANRITPEGQTRPTYSAGHTVGAPDGGDSLLFLGWSTTHGDLRIPHFIGIHALQIIPLVGLLLLSRREKWLSNRHRTALVFTTALGYLGLVGLLTWQALRQQSIVKPDELTLGALAALLSAVGVAVGAIILHARSNKQQGIEEVSQEVVLSRS